MSAPTVEDWRGMQRFARYLIGKLRVVTRCLFQMVASQTQIARVAEERQGARAEVKSISEPITEVGGDPRKIA